MIAMNKREIERRDEEIIDNFMKNGRFDDARRYIDIIHHSRKLSIFDYGALVCAIISGILFFLMLVQIALHIRGINGP